MVQHNRMSPLTALFIGIFGVGAVGIASGTAIVLYGMRIIDRSAFEVLGITENTLGSTLESLPQMLDSLPEAVGELLNDRRVPQYRSQVEVTAEFMLDERGNERRPVLTVRNTGEEVISLLAVRVVARNLKGLPRAEWTEVVATPLAVPDEWRGPLFPGETRYALLSRWHCHGSLDPSEEYAAAVEIADLRLWNSGQQE